MSRNLKKALVLAITAVAAAMLLAGCTVGGSGSVVIGGEQLETGTGVETLDLGEFDSVDANLSVGDVVLKAGDDYSVVIDRKNYPEVTADVADGKLSVSVPEGLWSTIDTSCIVTVTVPSSASLEQVDIETNTGSLSVEGIGSSTLEASTNVGDIDVSACEVGSYELSTDTGDITMSGGTVNVTAQSHEAFESKGAMTVSGGSLYAYSAGDDAINRGGSDTTTDMTLSGGFVCGWSAGNDGIDSNGNLYIQGATVYAVCTKGSPEVAVDANSEARKALYVKSGTLVSIGGLESGSSLTGSAYSTSSWAKSSMHVLCDSSGSPVLAFKTPASSSNGTMVLYCGGSALTLESGVTVDDGTLLWNGNGYEAPVFSGGSQVSLSSYSGSGGGGMFR